VTTLSVVPRHAPADGFPWSPGRPARAWGTAPATCTAKRRALRLASRLRAKAAVLHAAGLGLGDQVLAQQRGRQAGRLDGGHLQVGRGAAGWAWVAGESGGGGEAGKRARCMGGMMPHGLLPPVAPPPRAMWKPLRAGMLPLPSSPCPWTIRNQTRKSRLRSLRCSRRPPGHRLTEPIAIVRSRYEICEDMAQMLTEQRIDRPGAVERQRAPVLVRMQQALSAEGSPVQPMKRSGYPSPGGAARVGGARALS
jgi:hypothetical protein